MVGAYHPESSDRANRGPDLENMILNPMGNFFLYYDWIRISQPNPATNTQEIIKGSRQTTHVFANSLHAKKEEVTFLS